MGRKHFAPLLLVSLVLLGGCGFGGKMSADDVEEFLTSGKAFLPERGYTRPVCVDGSEDGSGWDYVCTYTIDTQPWHLGVNVSGDHPSDLSGAVPVTTPLPAS